MIERKTYTFRKGEIIDIEEYPEGKYGAPGRKREKKKKLTKEQMEKVNQANKERRCRHLLLEYFRSGDTFNTLTYEPKQRPQDMKGAMKDFAAAIRIVRREYRKRGYELFWIRNIEKGTRGAWHIHIVLNQIDDTQSILKKAWKKGGIFTETIRDSEKLYDSDFTKLAAYLTKDEKTVEIKADGTRGKPRIAQASYSRSRNMEVKQPKKDKLVRWKSTPKPKKGYYIARIYEGENPYTGYKYRRYTMIRLNRRI